MKKFLVFFAIEFVIILAVGYLMSIFLKIRINPVNQLLTAVTAAAVIAYAMKMNWGEKWFPCPPKRKSKSR